MEIKITLDEYEYEKVKEQAAQNNIHIEEYIRRCVIDSINENHKSEDYKKAEDIIKKNKVKTYSLNDAIGMFSKK